MAKNWDRDKFKKIIFECQRRRQFTDGSKVAKKREIHWIIAKKLFKSEETVRGWTKPRSNGPGDIEDVRNLEELLGVSLIKSEEESILLEENEVRLDEFNKQKVFECYEILKNFITEGDIESEEEYVKVRSEISKKRIAMPKSLYDNLSLWIDENLDPIIYDSENVLAFTRTSDLGQYSSDGAFKFLTEEKALKAIGMFMEFLMKLDGKLEQFADENIRPLLINV